MILFWTRANLLVLQAVTLSLRDNGRHCNFNFAEYRVCQTGISIEPKCVVTLTSENSSDLLNVT